MVFVERKMLSSPVSSAEGRSGERALQYEFRALYEAHGHYIHVLAARLLGAGIDAEDLVQETFIVALRKLPQAPITVPRAWLSSITIALAANFRRTRWFREFAARRDGEAEIEEVDWHTPELAAAEREQLRMLYGLLERISEKKRTVFLLFEVQGYTCAEIAKMLRIPEKTASSRLCAARSELARLLAKPGRPCRIPVGDAA